MKTTITLALVLVLGTMASADVVNVIDLELGLGIDGSGSISTTDFALQKNAYVAALNNLLPTNGSVAIGAWLFSYGVTEIFPVTIIDSQADKTALVNAIAAMTQPQSLTAIADTIDTAAAAILGNTIESKRQLIDISTDGAETVRGTTAPATAAAAAIRAGIDQVNGIGVGPYADLTWVPAGSFGVTADSFADFQTALERKIKTEIEGIPEPGTVALLGLGLLGLGTVVVRRRRR